jgi:hypothetical protein
MAGVDQFGGNNEKGTVLEAYPLKRQLKFRQIQDNIKSSIHG